MTELTSATLRCEPGRKARGSLEAVRRVDGTVLGMCTYPSIRAGDWAFFPGDTVLTPFPGSTRQ